MRAWLVALAVLVGCDSPPFTIKLAIMNPPNGGCPGTKCDQIPMACDSMVFVRIVDPNDTSFTYLSQCKQVHTDSAKDLCAIASVDVDSASLPAKTLDVQLVVLPLQLGSDGQEDCDSQVENLRFAAATGLPVADVDSPPIGGHAYYHPGDTETLVQLGCNDVSSLNVCTSANETTVNAAVTDFLTALPVSAAIGDQLTVSVGEPKPIAVDPGTEYVLNASDLTPLTRVTTGGAPNQWTGEVDGKFMTTACIDVLEDGAMTTATISCQNMGVDASPLGLNGVRLSQATLNKIIAAIPDPMFNLDKGVVLGIVIDSVGSAVPGLIVTPTDPAAHVRYLTDEAIPQFNGTMTSTNGIFLSTDAPFSTNWQTQHGAGTQLDTATGFGGLVDGKITIVVLQFAKQIST